MIDVTRSTSSSTCTPRASPPPRAKPAPAPPFARRRGPRGARGGDVRVEEVDDRERLREPLAGTVVELDAGPLDGAAVLVLDRHREPAPALEHRVDRRALRGDRRCLLDGREPLGLE